MNSKVSTIVNIVLGVAVIILFVLHFTSPRFSEDEAIDLREDTLAVDSSAIVAEVDTVEEDSITVTDGRPGALGKVGFVNMAVIQKKYKLYLVYQGEVKRRERNYENFVTAKQKELEGMQIQLQPYQMKLAQGQQLDLLEQEKAEALAQDIQVKGAKYQNEMMKMEESIGKYMDSQLLHVYKNINKAMADYGTDNDLDLVQPTSFSENNPNLMYFRPEYDVTLKVLEILNEKYTK